MLFSSLVFASFSNQPSLLTMMRWKLGEGGGWVLIHNLQLVQVRANLTGVCWGDGGEWELLEY